MSLQWLKARTDTELIDAATSLFQAEFAGKPAGIWAAPGRVNVIGDHVDYAGGICLPFAIGQKTAIAARLRDDSQLRIVSQLPTGEINRAEYAFDDIGPGHPANWAGYVAGTLWAMEQQGVITAPLGIELAIVSDVPVGAGLSSSAALECATALAAYELVNKQAANAEVREQLVQAAIRAENEVVGASTGGLDQQVVMFATAGAALALDFSQNTRRQIPFDLDAHDLALLIADTNAPHALNDGQYASRRGIIDAVTAALGKEGDTLRDISDAVPKAGQWAKENGMDQAMVQRRVAHVVEETARTADAIAALEVEDFATFQKAMAASHISLRDGYEVVTPELESAWEAAGKNGARMTGGGFGGSVIVLLPTSEISTVAHAITQAAKEKEFPQPQLTVAVPGNGATRLQ